MTDENLREVDFHGYCPNCKHEKLEEEDAPCCYCLENGVNDGTDRPVNFVEKMKKKQRE